MHVITGVPHKRINLAVTIYNGHQECTLVYNMSMITSALVQVAAINGALVHRLH